LLEKINDSRRTLALAPLSDVTPGISLSEGVIGGSASKLSRTTLNKTVAIGDVELFLKEMAAGETASLTACRMEAREALQDITGDASLLRSFRQRTLVRRGLELLEEDYCPYVILLGLSQSCAPTSN
jgi:hypothetical protein